MNDEDISRLANQADASKNTRVKSILFVRENDISAEIDLQIDMLYTAVRIPPSFSITSSFLSHSRSQTFQDSKK